MVAPFMWCGVEMAGGGAKSPSKADAMAASRASSSASVSLIPAGLKSLIPLSSDLLCEAETIRPRAAPVSRVIKATVGVGTMPSRTGLSPILVRPAIKAASIIWPERRVSRPMTTSRPPFGAKVRAAAIASRKADSAVMGGVFTRPRMPSVPKYCRAMIQILRPRFWQV